MKKIISLFCTAFILHSLNAVNVHAENVSRLYFSDDINGSYKDVIEISVDDIRNGKLSEFDMSVFIDDSTNNIYGVMAKWTCDSEFVTVRDIVNPTKILDNELNGKTSLNESFSSNITPFCFAFINNGKLKSNGSLIVDESAYDDKNQQYIEDKYWNNRLAATYTQNIFDVNGNQILKSSYLGAKSNEYPFVNFKVELSKDITVGDYIIYFVNDAENDLKSECSYYSGEGTTILQPITLRVTEKTLYVLGDVDENGTIDASDASLVLAQYASSQTGNPEILTDIQKLAADVDKNNVIDASDASMILAYYSSVQTGGNPSFGK